MAKRILMTSLTPEKSSQFNELMKEMSLSEDHELLNTALTLLWHAFQAKKGGKDIAIFDSKTDTVERIKMPGLDRVRPTIRVS